MKIAENLHHEGIIKKIHQLSAMNRRGGQGGLKMTFIKSKSRQFRVATRRLTRERELNK